MRDYIVYFSNILKRAFLRNSFLEGDPAGDEIPDEAGEIVGSL